MEHTEQIGIIGLHKFVKCQIDCEEARELEKGITKDTPKEDIPKNAYFDAEKKFLEKHVPRLKFISKIVKSRLEKDENVLILANTLEFGENLEKVLTYLFKNGEYSHIFYISGKMDEYERKRIREEMENGKRIIVIATTSLFSTGISVKNLHTAIFSSMGASKIRTIQSIGRTLRKHCSKECARVYDLVDDVKYSKKHAHERIQFYSDEEYDHEIYEVVL